MKVFVTGILALLVLFGTAGSVFAEGKGEKPDLPTPPEQILDGRQAVQITYWGTYTVDRVPYWEELFRRFMAKNPHIKVKPVQIPWANVDEKYTSAMMTGTGPDVSSMWVWKVPPFAALKGLEALEPWLDDWHYKDDMVPAAMGSSGAKLLGKSYHLPSWCTTRSIIYREDWFKEAGVAKPAFGWTWDELWNLSKKFSNPEKNRWGIQIRGGRGAQDWYFSVMLGFAGTNDFFDASGNCNLDAPGASDGLKYWADLFRDGYATPSTPTDGYQEIIANFGGGSAAMMAGHPGYVGSCVAALGRDKVGQAPWPTTSEGKMAVPWFWDGFSMWSASKHKDEAWELISYLCSPEAQSIVSRVMQHIPTNKIVWEEGWFKYNKYFPVVLRQTDAQYVTAYPFWLAEFNEFSERIGPKLYQEVCFNKTTAEDAAKQMAEFFTKAQKEYLRNR